MIKSEVAHQIGSRTRMVIMGKTSVLLVKALRELLDEKVQISR